MEPTAHVLRSPALYLGEIEIRPKVSTRKRYRSATLKKHLAAHLHLWFRRAPLLWTDAYLRLAAAFARGAYAVPGNRLRASCDSAATLARRTGHRLGGGEVYTRFVDAARLVLGAALRLYRRGPDAMLDRVIVSPASEARLRAVAASGRGGIIAVPHNVGAVLAATKIARLVPTVLVSKNSPSVERTRISLDLYERMGVSVLMVRDANPFALSRACLRALAEGRILVATVDRIDRTPQQVPLDFLGARVGFGAWAARIAVRAGAPIVPVYVRTTRRHLVVEFGEPRTFAGVEDGMRHYLAFFERGILACPWDWSFLADRRWRQVLHAAARGEVGDAARG